MSLQGRLRELGLPEVLQLLAANRKSGVLLLESARVARCAAVHVQQGSVVNATAWNADAAPVTLPARTADDAEAVEAVLHEVLLWRDGTFRFALADERVPVSAPVRIPIEPFLMDAAQRAAIWTRIQDRVPHARVVPALADLQPQQLPLLRLAPAQWEIFTRVDGQRDLVQLAASMGRSLMDVAEQVYDLIGVGMLTVHEGPVARRPAADVTDEDSLFDPAASGVTAPAEFPRRRVAPWAATPVASPAVEPSLSQGEAPSRPARVDAAALCRLGDEAARRGDFAGAMTHWNEALRVPEPFADAPRVREALALTTQLHALLHP